MAEYRKSFLEVFLKRAVLFPAKIIINRTKADVIEAIARRGSMSSSPRLILKAVGTVDQNSIASPA